MYESEATVYNEDIVECAECGALFTLEEHPHHVCNIAANIETRPSCSEEINVAALSEAVQARPALWDYTLPLKERGKDIRENMWKEVYEEINRVIPLENLEKKWKNLKDTSLKHLKTYKPSRGSVDDKKKWKHFNCMSFLADVNLNRKTFGNFEPVQSDVDLLSPLNTSTTDVDLSTPKSEPPKDQD